MARFRKHTVSKHSIIAGKNPVLEALQHHVLIDKILLNKEIAVDTGYQVREAAKRLNIPVQYVPVEKLNSLTKIQHQGVIAFRSSIQYKDVQEVIDFTVGEGQTPLFLILDGITDIRNIGAIARSAVCCGAQAIIIPDKGVGALNEDAMKTSAGALDLVNICRVNSLVKAVDTLHLNGIKVFASEMQAEKPLYKVNFKDPCAIVMGSEDKGIYPTLSRVCDEKIKIPMAGAFESLNVSVAAGIVLYEAMKQRLIH